jgi:hypothetical protein
MKHSHAVSISVSAPTARSCSAGAHSTIYLSQYFARIYGVCEMAYSEAAVAADGVLLLSDVGVRCPHSTQKKQNVMRSTRL